MDLNLTEIIILVAPTGCYSCGCMSKCIEAFPVLPYRTKVFIGINVCEIRDCRNREGFKPTKNSFHQALHACKQQ